MFPLTVLVPLLAVQVPPPATAAKLSAPLPPFSVPVTVVTPVTVRLFTPMARIPLVTFRVTADQIPVAVTVPVELAFTVLKA
jgi:hypothetical protein